MNKNESAKGYREGSLCDDLIIQDILNEQKRKEDEEVELVRKGDLLSCINREIPTNTWINGKSGCFKYFNDQQYRFCETHVSPEQPQKDSPVIACGFVAYLLKHWGEETEDIFTNYLEAKRYEYEYAHGCDPDAPNRDLTYEFYLYWDWEDENQAIKQLPALREFITSAEADLINGYIDGYDTYVRTKIKEYFAKLLLAHNQVIDKNTSPNSQIVAPQPNLPEDSEREAGNNVVDKPITGDNQIILPGNVLNWLQNTKCTNGNPKNNGRTHIEDAGAFPYKWLQNKHLLRELVTHKNIRGNLTIAEIERRVPNSFIDEKGNPLSLAKPKITNDKRDDNRMSEFLATIISC